MKGKIMSKSIDDVIQEKMKNPGFKKHLKKIWLSLVAQWHF